MQELKKHGLLLSILSVLLLIKFLLIPLLDWQNAIYQETTQLQKRLNKVTNVLASSHNLSDNVTLLQQEIDRAEKLFFKSETESLLKLEQQKTLESLLEQHSLVATNFSWQAKTPMPALGVYKYQINIRFDGRWADVVNALVMMERQSPWYEIDNFNLTSRGNSENSLGFIRGGRIMLNIYVKLSSETDNNPNGRAL